MSLARQSIILLAALGFAAGVGYALLTLDAGRSRPAATSKPAAAPHAADVPVADDTAPRDHIGDASRAAMREVLRDAEREED
jgi:uncharacterized membrane protein YdfJ with MMPL/SSD domain